MSYIERIRGPQAERATVTHITSSTIRSAIEGLHPYAAAAVGGELQRLDELPRPWSPNSYWDTTTFEVACNLIELANSPWSGYALADAERDLLAHAPRDSAWGPREHEKKWRSALDRIGSSSRPEPAPGERWEPPAVTLLAVDQDGANLSSLIRERVKFLDFIELLGTDDDGEDWILEPLLPARRLIALYSAPKVGKSLLMLEIAVGVALGVTALGVVPEPRRVLYVDFENDPRGDVKRRLEAMGYGPQDGAKLNENLCYWSFPSIAKLDTPQGGTELVTVAQEFGCEVIVIDTVSRAVGGEENANDTWLAFYRNTGMLMKAAGIACIRLDHSGKDAEKGMRGGSAKYGDVDAVWRLTAASESVLELQCTDHRFQIDEDRIALVRASDPLRHRVASDRTVVLDAKERQVIDALDALELPRETGNRVAKKALRDAGYTFGNPVIERAIKARKLTLIPRSRGTSGERSPASTVSPPSPASLKGAGTGNVETFPGNTPEDDNLKPMFQVACKKCYTPIHRDDAISGLCIKCAAAAGLTDPEGNPA